MVRQSGSDKGDDQQGWKFCDAHLQSSATVASGAGRSHGQAAACSCVARSKTRRRAECTSTEIASQRAAVITTVNSFAAGRDAAAYTWHDSAQPKNHEGSQRRDRERLRAVDVLAHL